ncbi:MFS transporter [Puia sp. P3]|uniref:MFS transporter n=1 Tax=Puia sp. P3 TaxID=3423952 RepID=UPI003D6737CB
MSTSTTSATSVTTTTQKTVFSILVAISFAHLLNDTMQSLIPSTYPLLKNSLHLDFGQLGLITFCFQLTASLLQPFVGLYTDKKPQPWSLAAGMCFTLAGLILLSQAASFPLVLVAVALVGIGSSIFHPEASRTGLSGFRRTEESGLISFPTGRQRRCFPRTAAGGPYHRVLRSIPHHVVWMLRPAGYRRPTAGRRMV